MAIPDVIRRNLGLRKEMSVGFYLTDFLFRKILRQNSGVTWPIHHTSIIHCPERITRGKNVFPGDSPGVYINANNGIRIGDYTNIGPNVGLVSSNHDFVNNEAYTPADGIDIGAYCWIGMGAVVLPSVKLGDFTIVGAGAVVTKSFTEGYCVIAGNPARIIKQLNKTECEAFAAGRK
ncbi:acyltransferase [Polluticoccus soli]|uniref:acyltransferase n=1 Tax=Polluticoccus soli TaxID=3034150 RepID=UPI0023E1148F|nr:acyltransferase [Flavipsychrobacter sp. JY13-12]